MASEPVHSFYLDQVTFTGMTQMEKLIQPGRMLAVNWLKII